MAVLYFAISFCFLSVTFGKPVDVNSPPTWPNAYTVSGVLKLPYAEIVEPFQAFFDGQNDRSRIDFYGGKIIRCFLSIETVNTKSQTNENIFTNSCNLIK